MRHIKYKMHTEKLDKKQLLAAVFLTGLLIGLIIGIYTGQTEKQGDNPSPSSEETLPEPYPTLENANDCPPKTSCPAQAPYGDTILPSKPSQDQRWEL